VQCRFSYGLSTADYCRSPTTLLSYLALTIPPKSLGTLVEPFRTTCSNEVRTGEIPAQMAMKDLVPVARASLDCHRWQLVCRLARGVDSDPNSPSCF
jgi:hypothetical protein